MKPARPPVPGRRKPAATDVQPERFRTRFSPIVGTAVPVVPGQRPHRTNRLDPCQPDEPTGFPPRILPASNPASVWLPTPTPCPQLPPASTGGRKPGSQPGSLAGTAMARTDRKTTTPQPEKDPVPSLRTTHAIHPVHPTHPTQPVLRERRAVPSAVNPSAGTRPSAQHDRSVPLARVAPGLPVGPAGHRHRPSAADDPLRHLGTSSTRVRPSWPIGAGNAAGATSLLTGLLESGKRRGDSVWSTGAGNAAGATSLLPGLLESGQRRGDSVWLGGRPARSNQEASATSVPPQAHLTPSQPHAASYHPNNPQPVLPVLHRRFMGQDKSTVPAQLRCG